MANAQISTSLTIVNSLLGFQAITLTNLTVSAESVIAAGSKVEVGGAFFSFSGDETPQASTWTAISTGNTAYITLTASGTAGSQILTAKYTDTAPVWSTAKQGYYSSAESLVRHIGSVTKVTGASDYQWANLLPNRQGELVYKTIAIGAWDMDADPTKQVGHRQTYTNIRTLEALINNDAENIRRYLIGPDGYAYAETNTVTLVRVASGIFDDTAYDDTAVNRGYLTIGFDL